MVCNLPLQNGCEGPTLILEIAFCSTHPRPKFGSIGEYDGEFQCEVGRTIVRKFLREQFKEDMDALLALDAASYLDPMIETFFTLSLDNNFNAAFLAKVDNQHVGSMIVSRRVGTGFVVIQQIAVLPKYRRQGIATDMLTALQKLYLSKNGPRDTLITTIDQDDFSSLNFFLGNGFQLLGSVILNGKEVYALAHKFTGVYFNDRKSIIRWSEDNPEALNSRLNSPTYAAFEEYLRQVNQFYNYVWQYRLDPSNNIPDGLPQNIMKKAQELSTQYTTPLTDTQVTLLLEEVKLNELNRGKILNILPKFQERFLPARPGNEAYFPKE